MGDRGKDEPIVQRTTGKRPDPDGVSPAQLATGDSGTIEERRLWRLAPGGSTNSGSEGDLVLSNSA